MASLKIRNLDENLMQCLRTRAAAQGRSMAEEVREILRQALDPPATPANLGQVIHRRFAGLRGVDLEPPPREPMPEPPSLD